METHLDFNGVWWAIDIQVTAELTIWAVFLNAAYNFIIGTLAMRDPKHEDKNAKLKEDPNLIMVEFKDSKNVNPPMEIELTHAEEWQAAEYEPSLAFELPKKCYLMCGR